MKRWIPKSVLLAGPVSEDSFAENIAVTLKSMDLAVVTDQWLTQGRYNSRWRSAIREARHRLSRGYVSQLEHRLIKLARQRNPELLLAPTQVISEETLFELKRTGIKACVAWWGDPPANMKRIGLLSDQWDIIFIKDPDCVQKFKRVGLNAHLLHEAMNPLWHKPVAQQANEDVVVAGNAYEYRQFLLRHLMAKGVSVRLYGDALPRWVHPDIKGIDAGRYIVHEEKSRIFGEGLACLNSTQIIEGNSLNCRAFEVSGAGGLHVMEYRPIISECFELGKEVLTFDSLEELFGHIERARRYPQEMRPIREAGAKRVLAEHTYRHRLEKILEMVGEL